MHLTSLNLDPFCACLNQVEFIPKQYYFMSHSRMYCTFDYDIKDYL